LGKTFQVSKTWKVCPSGIGNSQEYQAAAKSEKALVALVASLNADRAGGQDFPSFKNLESQSSNCSDNALLCTTITPQY
jgi:hypothetical protein